MTLRTHNNGTGRVNTMLLLAFVFISYAASLAVGWLDAASAANGRSTTIGTISRVVSVKDRVSLKVTKADGTTLNASGQLSGTFNGSVTLNQSVVSSERSVGSFVAYLNGGGSMKGRSTTLYYVSGSISRYTGTMSISGGTGRYSHASATGLRLSGTYNRVTGRMNLSLSGQIHL